MTVATPISHDAELGLWIADLEQALARAKKPQRPRPHWDPPEYLYLPPTRPGREWAAARVRHPEFIAAIEHCQARGIPVLTATVERLIAFLRECVT